MVLKISVNKHPDSCMSWRAQNLQVSTPSADSFHSINIHTWTCLLGGLITTHAQQSLNHELSWFPRPDRKLTGGDSLNPDQISLSELAQRNEQESCGLALQCGDMREEETSSDATLHESLCNGDFRGKNNHRVFQVMRESPAPLLLLEGPWQGTFNDLFKQDLTHYDPAGHAFTFRGLDKALKLDLDCVVWFLKDNHQCVF